MFFVIMYVHVCCTLTGTLMSAWENAQAYQHNHTAATLQCFKKLTEEDLVV